MTVFRELKRRNVFKVATAYLITAWLILQVASVIEPHIGLPSWFIPFIITILTLGLPIACLLAWAFELTPEGIKATKLVAKEESITATTGKKMNTHIIIAMSIAMVFLIYQAYFTSDDTVELVSAERQVNSENINKVEDNIDNDTNLVSIAVLPFVNMSNDPEQEYFSDGLSEELLNVLAGIEQLKVAARTSSFFFKDKNMDVADIAQKLKVEHILEGSVRRSGNQLRVTAQLIKADTGYHLWSSTYDYEFEDVFKIQDEISLAVAKQLKVTLLPEEKDKIVSHQYGTKNASANDAYMLGRYHMRARTPESLKKAEKAFNKSLVLDENNQLAISGLVDTLLLKSSYADLTKEQYLAAAEPLLKPFINRENNSGEMFTSIASYYESKQELHKAKNYFEKAIEQNPNYATAFQWLAEIHYSLVSNKNEVKRSDIDRYFDKALSLDPYSEIILVQLFYASMERGDLLATEEYLNRIFEINPNSSRANAESLGYYWSTGRDWEKAWKIANNENVQESVFWLLDKLDFFIALNEPELAKKQYVALQSKKYNPYIQMAGHYIYHSYLIGLEQYSKQQLDIDMQRMIELATDAKTIKEQVAVYLLSGKKELALSVMLKEYGHLIDQVEVFSINLYELSLLTYCLRLNDDERWVALSKKSQILQNNRAKLLTNDQTFLAYRVLMTLMNAETDVSLKELAKVYVDNTHFINALSLDSAYMTLHLRDNKEFQSIAAIAKQKLAKKVEKFKQSSVYLSAKQGDL